MGEREKRVSYTPPPGQGSWPHVRKWRDGEWTHWLMQQGWSLADCRLYLDRLRYQFGFAAVKGKGWLYLPTPKQVAFHANAAPNVFYGGAVGGAKSHALRWDAHRRGMAIAGLRMILFRRTLVELKDNHINEAKKEADLLGAEWNQTDKILTYPTGSWLRFAHCENEGDEDKYLSSEYDWGGLDELATFLRTQAMGIATRLRTSAEGLIPLFRATSNPGGAHTLWIKQWFMDKAVTTEDDPFYDPAEWAFIGSRLYDNPWLMDPDGTFRRYEKRLGPMPAERRRQLLEGDWDAVAGQFFSSWRADKHVVDLGPIDRDVRRICGLDWGYNAPGCCLWVACLPDGRYYVEHEYKFNGTAERQTVKEVAAEIHRRSKALGLARTPYVAMDPATKQHTGQVGESILETFQRYRVPAEASNNDRKNGWQRIQELLRDAPDGQPWLQVHPSCRYLIRTLPAAVQDDHEPDDVDTEGDDHALDALRYWAMSRPVARGGGRQKPKPKEWSLAWLTRQGQAPAGPLARRSA